MRARTIDVLVLACLTLGLGAGCARSSGPAAEPPEPAKEVAAAASPSLQVPTEGGERASERRGEAPSREALGGAGERFAAASVDGAFILRRAGEPDRTYGGALVDSRHVPCSTFKIPNALISLETGAVEGVDVILPWDGEERRFAGWNRDHDLRSAMENSVVWYFQELARRVGLATMSAWVERLDYGNHEIGDEVDRFWLEGPLRISAAEEVRFIDRLIHGRLPVSEASVASVRGIVPVRTAGDVTVRAKTGACLSDDEREFHGWLVGWVEREGETLGSFALLLTEAEDIDALVDARWPLALQLLGDAGLGAGASTGS